MIHRSSIRSLTLPAIAGAMFAAVFTIPAVGALVTTNLFTQLDGSNLSAGAVSNWADQKFDEDGTATNNHQDFGQATTGNQPTAVANFTMPNGTNHTIVDFTRGSVTSSNNSNTGSHYLRGRTGGDVVNGFGGADSAYEVANGLSWFAVFRSDIVTTSTTSNNERQQRQGVLYSSYDSLIDFGTRYINTSGGGGTEQTAELFNAARDGVGGDELGNFYGDVASPASWYITGAVWDLSLGSLTSRFISELQVTLNDDHTLDPWTTPLPTHLSSFLGAISVPGTASWALDGQIAEVLIYNAALSGADFNAVMGYLNGKYFIVPEASPVWFGGLACGAFGLVHIGRRLRKRWAA
ncbi:MAG: hypothetical protein WD468_12805 [Pirellulales bacterium]